MKLCWPLVSGLFIILFLFLPHLPGHTAPGNPDDSKRFYRVMMLVDYIGTDYQGAVAAGKILSPTEYQEMIGFAETLGEQFNTLASAEHLPASQAGPIREQI